jgi:putative MATE family efflux protein
LHFGKVGYSAFVIGLRAEGIAYMPAIGFGVAATTLAGQYLGAKKEELAKAAVMTATKFVIILMAIAGAILIIFPEPIAGIFTNDRSIIEIAVFYLFLMGFSEPFLGMVFTIAGGMRGAGYTRVPMYVNFLSLIVVRLLLIYFLAFTMDLGIEGIWYAIVLETVIRALALYAVFLRGSWMKVKV